MEISKQGIFQSIHQFQPIQTASLGQGSFGFVHLFRHRRTCRLYAIKIIQINDQIQGKMVQRQIKIHLQLNHPHIIKLWDAIFYQNRVYMILQYANYGSLFSYLMKRKIFSEHQAFRFFSQALEAVKYLHGKDCIHRDIKPQNILIDSDFNVKMCDFGWCAKDIKEKRSTFCGTYEYMSPEMLLFKIQYDYRIDIWALGVLLYQLLHGCAPFRGKTAQEVQKSMMTGKYEIKIDLSRSAKDLINGILQIQPDKRLSIQQIVNHSWMKCQQTLINKSLEQSCLVKPYNIYQKIKQISFTNQQKIQQSKQTISLKHKKNSSMDPSCHLIQNNIKTRNIKQFSGQKQKANKNILDIIPLKKNNYIKTQPNQINDTLKLFKSPKSPSRKSPKIKKQNFVHSKIKNRSQLQLLNQNYKLLFVDKPKGRISIKQKKQDRLKTRFNTQFQQKYEQKPMSYLLNKKKMPINNYKFNKGRLG